MNPTMWVKYALSLNWIYAVVIRVEVMGAMPKKTELNFPD